MLLKMINTDISKIGIRSAYQQYTGFTDVNAFIQWTSFCLINLAETLNRNEKQVSLVASQSVHRRQNWREGARGQLPPPIFQHGEAGNIKCPHIFRRHFSLSELILECRKAERRLNVDVSSIH